MWTPRFYTQLFFFKSALLEFRSTVSNRQRSTSKETFGYIHFSYYIREYTHLMWLHCFSLLSSEEKTHGRLEVIGMTATACFYYSFWQPTWDLFCYSYQNNRLQAGLAGETKSMLHIECMEHKYVKCNFWVLRILANVCELPYVCQAICSVKLSFHPYLSLGLWRW